VRFSIQIQTTCFTGAAFGQPHGPDGWAGADVGVPTVAVGLPGSAADGDVAGVRPALEQETTSAAAANVAPASRTPRPRDRIDQR